ncbi:LysR substrate-binding domain-containing protein [Burkholderia multivorans]|uniref:LysR substrate-binding domain-containing protein n=1 Tax=Burkholderia multivorans TaxID=87883 RepID=UPI00286AA1DF|nr:LysR substrate-binding domain-containing protein [Burkholderia multivorans]
MRLNLHLLRVFFTVAELRSFSRAAEALFISQPAVSKAVRELECQIGLPLLERGAGGPKSARGVQLTPDGAAVFEHARGIFALERAAIEDVQARVGLQRGRLRVGASTTVGAYWLPQLLADFVHRHPAVDVQVVQGNTQMVCEALLDCRIDIGLVEGDVHDPRLAAHTWREEPLCVVAGVHSPLARSRRLTAATLSSEIWLLREPGSGTRDVADRLLHELAIRPQRCIEIGSNEGIARAVAAGLGVALLPMRVVRELLALREVAALKLSGAPKLVRLLWRVEPKGRPPSPLVLAWREALARPLAH